MQRDIGGFGYKTENPIQIPDIPSDQEPDLEVEENTFLQQSLLYRLIGDVNPVHADPVQAKKCGFERPIFFGLVTKAIVARKIYDHFIDRNSERLKAI